MIPSQAETRVCLFKNNVTEERKEEEDIYGVSILYGEVSEILLWTDNIPVRGPDVYHCWVLRCMLA